MNDRTGAPERFSDCVVIDTCIWRSELLLNTSIGKSLVYTLGRQHGFIGLPEIVEREIKSQIVEAGFEDLPKMEKCFRTINTLTDNRFPEPPITRELLEDAVEARIKHLEPILVRVPFTHDHAKGVLDMIIRKLPPNTGTNQQFKDSAIWQAVLTLAQKYKIHFVTNDRAFLYKPSDPSQGLAPNLREACQGMPGTVAIYCDLGSCLTVISNNTPTFDHDVLASLVESFARPRIEIEASRNRLVIGEVQKCKLSAFHTAVPNQIALDYTIAFQCSQMTPNPRTPESGSAIAHGNCYLNTATNSIVGAFVEAINIQLTSPSGLFSLGKSFNDLDPAIPFRRPSFQLDITD